MKLLAAIVDDKSITIPALAALIGVAIEFIYDALADRRREHFAGAGVFLATIHAAKGTEFPHVLVMGGGWPTRETTEEERRVYYVGMTRAKETVCLLERRDCPNPFTGALKGDFVFSRDCPPAVAVESSILDRRYESIGMTDIYLDMAGRRSAKDPIHRRIAALQPGDTLRLQREHDCLNLVDADGHLVARLSQQAYEKWKDRVASVDAVRVAAVVMRETADCADPNYAAHLLVPTWGIPLAEVMYRRTP